MSKAKSDKVSPDLDTPTDLPQAAVDKISASLNVLLADAFALYVKTKNFHWHVSGRHFRDYHLMLDEQSDAIFATTDQLAERVRKLGGTTLRSIGQRVVWTLLVVVTSPLVEFSPRVAQVQENFHVQAFIAQPSVEAFDVASRRVCQDE